MQRLIATPLFVCLFVCVPHETFRNEKIKLIDVKRILIYMLQSHFYPNTITSKT